MKKELVLATALATSLSVASNVHAEEVTPVAETTAPVAETTAPEVKTLDGVKEEVANKEQEVADNQAKVDEATAKVAQDEVDAKALPEKKDELAKAEEELPKAKEELEKQKEAEKPLVDTVAEDTKAVEEATKKEEEAKAKVDTTTDALNTEKAKLAPEALDKAKADAETAKSDVTAKENTVAEKQAEVEKARKADEDLAAKKEELATIIEENKQILAEATTEKESATNALNKALAANAYPSEIHLSNEWYVKFKEHFRITNLSDKQFEAEFGTSVTKEDKLEALRQELVAIEKSDAQGQQGRIKQDFTVEHGKLDAWNTRYKQTDGTINPNELSDELKVEIAQHIATLINDVRKNMGITEMIKVNSELMTFAAKVADNYVADNRNDESKGHYVAGITKAAGEMGLSSGDNYYENLAATVIRPKLYTKDELFALIDSSFVGFFYEGYQNYGHAYSLLTMDTLGVDMSVVKNERGNDIIRTHILSVPNYWAITKTDEIATTQQRKDSYENRFGKNSNNNLALPETKTAEEMTALRDAVQLAELKFNNSTNVLANNQDTMNTLNATPLALPGAESALATANSELTTARQTLTDANALVSELETNRDAIMAKVNELETELSGLTAQLDEAVKVRVDAVAKLNDDQAKLDAVQGTIKELTETVDRLEKAIPTLKAEIDTLIENAKDDEENRKALADLVDKQVVLEAELETAKKELAILQAIEDAKKPIVNDVTDVADNGGSTVDGGSTNGSTSNGVAKAILPEVRNDSDSLPNTGSTQSYGLVGLVALALGLFTFKKREEN